MLKAAYFEKNKVIFVKREDCIMPVIQSQGIGYYNYYDISSRYKCELVQ